MSYSRIDGRAVDQLRAIKIVPGVNDYAEGSVEVSFGNTKLLVTASVDTETPRWMEPGQGGWITAEYGMLPRATHTRNRREASAGKQSGRTQEIQRLIGRSLRQAVDLSSLKDITIKIDCDVLQADGGTRTAAISGGWVALYQAIGWCKQQGIISNDVEIKNVTAISVGSVEGNLLLDLCYEEDSNAEFDLNLVFDAKSNIIELQGTAEKKTLSRSQINDLLNLGELGANQIVKIQQEAL